MSNRPAWRLTLKPFMSKMNVVMEVVGRKYGASVDMKSELVLKGAAV